MLTRSRILCMVLLACSVVAFGCKDEVKEQAPKGDKQFAGKEAASNTEQLANRAFDAVKAEDSKAMASFMMPEDLMREKCPGFFDAEAFAAGSFKAGMFSDEKIAEAGGKEALTDFLKVIYEDKYGKHVNKVNGIAQLKEAAESINECWALGDFKTAKFVGISGGEPISGNRAKKLSVSCPTAQALHNIEVAVELAGKMTQLTLGGVVKFEDDIWVLKAPYCMPADL